jgi:allantoicase
LCSGKFGYLTQVELDTADFKGNFPQSCEIHATNTSDLVPTVPDDQWIQVLPRTSLGPHRRHFFPLENSLGKEYSHVKLTIYPDGGIKRIRIIGSQQPTPTNAAVRATEAFPQARDVVATLPTIRSIPALPLTSEAFAPFGQVLQAYSSADAAPRNTKVTIGNQGTALKFHKLSLIDSAYPPNSGATAGLSVSRSQPIRAQLGGEWDIKLLERHKHNNQAFIPMAGGNVVEGGESLTEHARFYLVIVAKNAENDIPDLESMRAFLASAGQGVVYNAGTWRTCKMLFRLCVGK